MMMQHFSINKFFFSAGLVMTLAFLSCGNEIEEVDKSTFGYQYFPLEIGQYKIYAADSITFTSGGASIDTGQYFIKEEVVEILEDTNGDSLYRIERSLRDNEDAEWQVRDVWVAGKNESIAFRTEENLKFIKLVFPMKLGDSWNGNIFFDPYIEIDVKGEQIEVYKNWDYRFLEEIAQVEMEGITFNDVRVIQQADFESSIELRLSKEYYAEGIGLIYQEMLILDTQCIEDCIGLSWEEKAERGFILKQNLIEYN
jgi:hypothetical protein